MLAAGNTRGLAVALTQAALPSQPHLPAPVAVPSPLLRACFALCVANALLFPLASLQHIWIYDAQGYGQPVDFVGIWSAGKLVLSGHAVQAYDWDIHKQVEVAALGQDFDGIYGWHYPPPFLFVAALLAQLPYGAALVAWCAASFVPYAIAIRAIVGHPVGWLLAAGFPAVVANVFVGHNGFLTAALIGGGLYLLPRRPVLAGICIGLLTYKPQFGVLFPLALLVAWQWRVIASATVTALAMAAVSSLAFGVESWVAFAHWLPRTSHRFLSVGGDIFGKFQSLYSAVRYFGGGEQLAWMCQGALSVVVALAVAWLWRSRAAYDLKAAALATGTLLVTPYLFVYDMVVLAVAVAFLVRFGLREGFRGYELPGLALAGVFILSFVAVTAPVGLLATATVAALIAARGMSGHAPPR